jgi:cytochrome c oxidase subunit 2
LRPASGRVVGRLLVVGCLLVASGLVTGCLPQPGTTQAQAADTLYWIAMGFAALVGVIVYGLMTFAILRYRRRRTNDDGEPPQTSGSRVLEALWTVGPLVIVTILMGATLVTLDTIAGRRADGGAQIGAINLHVTGFRWGWRFEFPDAGVVVQADLEPGPTIELPVGRPVTVTLDSADVIHSFYVPQFLYKRDAFPDRVNIFTLTIAAPGTYGGVCAEFCGLYHARMPFTIVGVSDADFDAWLADQRAGAGATGSPAP